MILPSKTTKKIFERKFLLNEKVAFLKVIMTLLIFAVFNSE